MAGADLNSLMLTEAAAALARGEISSTQLVQAFLDRIAEREPQVQAFAYLDREHALAQAGAADTVRREGKGVGPLNGIPIGIKDIIDTADMPTECGSPIFKGRQPDTDAACVAAVRRAGAIILGKTVTTELASLTPSKTRNPHNLEHTPGGSSSGSAAAVACGMIPAALATQTAGSVIRPASFCGIYGFKPTFGLIPRGGVLMQSHTLDTIGVYGRCVEDLALLAASLATYDETDAASYPRSRPAFVASANEEVPVPPLFAFLSTPAWEEADAVTKEAFAELIDALGAQVESLDLPSLESAIEFQQIVQAAENAAYYGGLLKHAPDVLSPALRQRLEKGQATPAPEYIQAVRAREAVYGVVEDVLRNYTAILTPAAAGPAPKGLASTGNPVFNGMWTWLGTPAVTLPLLEVDGLPIGVQLIGSRRDDGRLLRTARWLVNHLAAST